MRDSFVFYTEYADVLEALTAEQAGYLIRGLVKYAKGEEPDLEDPVVRAVFMTIKPRMDRDAEKWEAEVERRREAGRKGGKAKASKAKQSQAKPSKAKESQAIQAVSDADSVNDTENINPPPSPLGGRETQKAMLDRLLSHHGDQGEIPDMVKTALSEWISYKGERNERYKELGMKTLISQAAKNAREYGASAVARVIRESMSSGYKGIMWDRISKKPRVASKFNNATQRHENMAELERALLAT